LNAEFGSPNDDPTEVFESDSDLLALREHITTEFLDTFKDGVDAYLNGDWIVAKDHLEKADYLMFEALPKGSGNDISHPSIGSS
jgi:hypothetical protein